MISLPTPKPGRILILHTGGTIGMASSPDGYRPLPDFPARLRAELGKAECASVPDCDIVELTPIDSADLRPSHWTIIAKNLLAHWESYSGFVVLHGTDTMAWSAAALSFMLRGSDKPVIFTGSQIPWLEPDSDAPDNLLGALHFAADPAIREVCLYFGHQLLRGNRSRKLSATQLAAFASPNAQALAEGGRDFHLHRDRLLDIRPKQFAAPAFDDLAVAVITVHPGLSANLVDALSTNPSVRGIVLQTYGVGNAPQGDHALMDALERAADRGIVLVNVTQCLTGSVSQETYATGTVLARLGVIPGRNMTLEAAFAKLHFLLATENTGDRIRNELNANWCGELD